MKLGSILSQLVASPKLASFNKQLTIKCVWAIANVKQTDKLQESGMEIMGLIVDLLKHKVIFLLCDSTLDLLYDQLRSRLACTLYIVLRYLG